MSRALSQNSAGVRINTVHVCENEVHSVWFSCSCVCEQALHSAKEHKVIKVMTCGKLDLLPSLTEILISFIYDRKFSDLSTWF